MNLELESYSKIPLKSGFDDDSEEQLDLDGSNSNPQPAVKGNGTAETESSSFLEHVLKTFDEVAAAEPTLDVKEKKKAV